MVMKIGIYIRVSTEDQVKEGHSLEVQREYLEAFAMHEGHEIFKIYSDDGISAYSTRRPALQELLADARAKRFELVVVYKIDRFSRNLKDLLMLVDELSSYGVAFKSATEPFDTTTSAGMLMFQQLGSFAEFERNRIAERVFPGMLKGVQQGNWQGARYSPYGYKYNKANKLLEVDEEEELQKRIALQELREVERERSKDYLNRVEEFISGYDPKQKELSLDQQKQVVQLLFKNIKIAHKKIFSFNFFAPFNFLFFEQENFYKCQQNQGLPPKKSLQSILGLSAVR